MTTSSSIMYNKTSEQAERIPVFCDTTKRLLTRIDAINIAQLANIQHGGMWCWCRGCHMEHHILWKDLAPKGAEK